MTGRAIEVASCPSSRICAYPPVHCDIVLTLQTTKWSVATLKLFRESNKRITAQRTSVTTANLVSRRNTHTRRRHGHATRTRRIAAVALLGLIGLFCWRGPVERLRRPSLHAQQDLNTNPSATPYHERPLQLGADFNWTDVSIHLSCQRRLYAYL